MNIDESVGIELPPGWLQSGEATARMIVRQALPPGFHEAGMILQRSSGQRPDATIASPHLWFWLSRPLFSWEAQDWMSNHPLVDLHPQPPAIKFPKRHSSTDLWIRMCDEWSAARENIVSFPLSRLTLFARLSCCVGVLRFRADRAGGFGLTNWGA